MICANCDYKQCRSDYCNDKAYWCPACYESFIPSEDHLFFVKLKENLKLEISEIFTNQFTWTLKYKNRKITSAYLEIPISRLD